MPKNLWPKDSCPYCKDQGFDAVVGGVAPGESIFGIVNEHSGTGENIVFRTVTNGKVTMMADNNYRVLVTKISGGSVGATTVPYVYEQYKDHFKLLGENGEDYDVIVIGKIAY
jgi:hypothetical protein